MGGHGGVHLDPPMAPNGPSGCPTNSNAKTKKCWISIIYLMVAIFLQNRGQKFVEHFCFPVTVLNEGFPFRVNGKLKLLKTNIDKTKNKMINKYTRRVPTSKPVTP